MSRQSILNYDDLRTALPSTTEWFTDDYMALKEDITELFKGLSPQFGTGSPEGVVTATASLVYYDVALSPVSVTGWFNDTIGKDTGWTIII